MINKDFITLIYPSYERPPEVKYEPDIHAESGMYYIVAPQEKWTLSKTEGQFKERILELESRLHENQEKFKRLIMILDPDYFDKVDNEAD